MAKTKLTPSEYARIKGTVAALRYTKKGKYYVMDVRLIKALHVQRTAAKKFCLEVLTSWGKSRLYVAKDGYSITRKGALEFAYGFEDPAVTLKKYLALTGLPLTIKN